MQQDLTASSEYVPGGLSRAHHRTGEVPLKEIEAARAAFIAQQPTTRQYAAQLPMKRLALPEKAQLHVPIGPDGRPFIVARSEMSTLDILKVVVKEYFLATHAYPSIIEIDSYRWNKYGMFTRFFYPHADLAIPIECAASNEYDVVVRGPARKEEN